jgi:hypothetical protein
MNQQAQAIKRHAMFILGMRPHGALIFSCSLGPQVGMDTTTGLGKLSLMIQMQMAGEFCSQCS